MFYTGLKYRTGDYLAPVDMPHDSDQGAIHLATLRIDGWVSLDSDATAAGGLVTTEVFVAPGSGDEGGTVILVLRSRLLPFHKRYIL
jgi:hypothetical protein